MKKAKQILAVLMAVLMLVAYTAACSNDDGGTGGTGGTADGNNGATGDSPGTGDDGGEQQSQWEPRYLNGMEVFIGDWYSDPDSPVRARNLRDEQIQDQRFEMETEWGYTIKQGAVADFGDFLEIFTTSVMAGDPAADVFVMFAGSVPSLIKKGLLYPLNTIPSIDVNDWRWNAGITQEYSDEDGNVYALSGDRFLEAHNFIFYNKRLFAEAGLDPDLPYDLQASGEWTWDKFREICEILTRDIDGDGITDIFAMTGFGERTINTFINSNEARHFGVDDDGKIFNGMLEPNFIEAMQFVKDLYDDGLFTTDGGDEDVEWWWHDELFRTARAAMIPSSVWQTGDWRDNLADEWGMVFAPMGPRASTYWATTGVNPLVLPFNTDPEKAAEIMFAISKYFEPLPSDYENPDYWKYTGRGYENFVDTRAVDETLEMFYNGHSRSDTKGMVDGVEWGPVYEWGFLDYTEFTSVIEKIEAAAPIIQAAIDKANENN